MEEQSKAIKRRSLDPRFKDRWFVGRGIDIGCGPNPLSKEDWPNVTEVVPYDKDLGHGDAMFMASSADEEFDFVVSSHCLEHLYDPRAALKNWTRILRPGGYIVCTVPDELLYEYGQWPSRFNTDHKNSFTLRATPMIITSVSLPWLLWKMHFDVELLQLVTAGWDRSKIGQDQTQGEAESSIEFVVRKPDPNSPI